MRFTANTVGSVSHAADAVVILSAMISSFPKHNFVVDVGLVGVYFCVLRVINSFTSMVNVVYLNCKSACCVFATEFTYMAIGDGKWR